MPSELTWALQALNRLVRDHLAPLLKRHGYRKSGLTWRLRSEDPVRGWGVVNLQKSAWGSRDDIHFTINLGVWWDGAQRPSRIDRISGRGPSESTCHIRERLGMLDKEPRDIWWEIDGGRWSPGEGPDCLEPVIATVLPLLEKRGLKWIERRMTPRALAAYKLARKKTGFESWKLPESSLGTARRKARSRRG